MVTDTEAVRRYFAKLGLAQEVADIYLALHTHGPQSISELSRNARVERTRIYRLIDQLMDSNLIELEGQSARGVIKAAPISNLHVLINQREQELKSLQDELNLIEQVLARNSLSTPAVRLQTYHGAQGVRQLLWNILSAKSEILGYCHQPLEAIIGKKLAQQWASEYTTRGLQAAILTNEQFTTNQETASAKAKNNAGYSSPKGLVWHTVNPTHFTATHFCMVYDDIVSYIHRKDNEIYGLEIHNQTTADAQRQLLEQINKDQSRD
jgi:sugar-specific transcriptional regulator TrmB